jgi:hypothetical protein
MSEDREKQKLQDEIIEEAKSNLSKRAKLVVDHILKHGFITTEDLEKYGYKHPPRAARDVREGGIPLVTFTVKSSDQRSIAAYKFGDLTKIRMDILSGRKTLPKSLKDELFIDSSGKCAICSGRFESRYFQIDHRIPYEVAGDLDVINRDKSDYMLLCSSCNRAKSWSCEHCSNWLTEKSVKVCQNCYWTSPENYIHIALKEVRRVDILWENGEVEVYEKLKVLASKYDYPIPDYVKKIITKCLEENNENA